MNNVSINVGGVAIVPGGSANVRPSMLNERSVSRLKALGALHLGDEPPMSYQRAATEPEPKTKPIKAVKKKQRPKARQTLKVETKVDVSDRVTVNTTEE